MRQRQNAAQHLIRLKAVERNRLRSEMGFAAGADALPGGAEQQFLTAVAGQSAQLRGMAGVKALTAGKGQQRGEKLQKVRLSQQRKIGGEGVPLRLQPAHLLRPRLASVPL